MVKNRKYSNNNRLAACLLLAVFVFLSIQMPLLNRNVHEKNNNITGHYLICLQESMIANSYYQAPVIKCDFGKHRTAFCILWVITGSLLCNIHFESGALQKSSAETIFPLHIIPAYLLDRVLRI